MNAAQMYDTYLLRLNLDGIVAANDAAGRAAQQATTRIPIVIAVIGDPVGSGFVNTLARPGGNITGLSMQAPDFAAKRLQLLKGRPARVPSGAPRRHQRSRLPTSGG